MVSSKIMTEIESKVVEAWQQAAKDLGIQFTSPFTVSIQDTRIESIGFVHHFGRRFGTIISVLNQPSSLAHSVGKWQNEDYFLSVLGPSYGRYVRQEFIDTLDDWQFFGPDLERPAWYTGKPWGSS